MCQGMEGDNGDNAIEGTTKREKQRNVSVDCGCHNSDYNERNVSVEQISNRCSGSLRSCRG